MTEKLTYFDLSKEGTTVSGTDLDITLTINAESVLDSVLNIITTEKKSRVFRKRDFGCSLMQYIHDPLDIFTAHNILREIESSISKYEPRALDLLVEITPFPNENTFVIDINFRIQESENTLQLSKLLKEIR